MSENMATGRPPGNLLSVIFNTRTGCDTVRCWTPLSQSTVLTRVSHTGTTKLNHMLVSKPKACSAPPKQGFGEKGQCRKASKLSSFSLCLILKFAHPFQPSLVEEPLSKEQGASQHWSSNLKLAAILAAMDPFEPGNNISDIMWRDCIRTEEVEGEQ